MSTKVNRRTYERLIAEDLDWLLRQPRTLEREHIAAVLQVSPEREYETAIKARAELESAAEAAEDEARRQDGTENGLRAAGRAEGLRLALKILGGG